jgi:hypothetical protein
MLKEILLMEMCSVNSQALPQIDTKGRFRGRRKIQYVLLILTKKIIWNAREIATLPKEVWRQKL